MSGMEKKRKREEVEAEYKCRVREESAEREETVSVGVGVGQKRKKLDRPEDMLVSNEGFDDEEKLLRTVFVSNLPSKIKKKVLLREFGQFGEIESITLRFVPLDEKTPSKGAIMKRLMNDAVGRFNAYIVFKEEGSAQASLSCDMIEIGGNHIHVNRACPPRKRLKQAKMVEHDGAGISCWNVGISDEAARQSGLQEAASDDLESQGPTTIANGMDLDFVTTSPLDYPNAEKGTPQMGSGAVSSWRGHALDPVDVDLLRVVESHYPKTFKGVRVRSELIWVACLTQFCRVIASFMTPVVPDLSKEAISILVEDLVELEGYGFDLSWAFERLMTVKSLSFVSSLQQDLVEQRQDLVLLGEEMERTRQAFKVAFERYAEGERVYKTKADEVAGRIKVGSEN